MARPSLRWLVGIAVASACALPRDAMSADPTSLACIHTAEEGQAARDQGKLLRARELFATCSARECPAVLRRDCATWVEEAKQATPSVVVVARDPSGRDIVDAKASVDGVLRQTKLDGTVIELDPGAHVVRVDMTNHPAVEVRVVFGAGEKNRTIVLTMANEIAPPRPIAPPKKEEPEEPHARGLPAATYVFGALGIAALGSFGYFALRGSSDADHLKSTCVPGCNTSDVNAVHTKLLIADVSLGVGIVSLAAATYFALAHAHQAPPPAQAWEVRAAPHAHGASGEIVIRF